MKEVTTTFTRYGQPGITQTSQMHVIRTAWNHTDKSDVHGTDSLESQRQVKCMWYGQPEITQTYQMYVVRTAWNHTDISNVHGTDSLESHRQIKCIWGQRDPQVDMNRENPQNIDCTLCGLIFSFLAHAVGRKKNQSTRNAPKSQRHKTNCMMVQLTSF